MSEKNISLNVILISYRSIETELRIHLLT